jgi:hypothetical protein
MEKETTGDFPTFTPLEELETQQEEETSAAEEPAKVEDNKEEPAEAKEEAKPAEDKKGTEANPFEPLNLEKTEESQDEDDAIEISNEEAIDNFNKALALGTLIAPDDEDFEYDGSEEATERVHAHTLKVWQDRAKEELFSKIEDPYMQELVDYGMQAGNFADLERFGKSLKEHSDVNKIDLGDPDQTRSIIREHLSDLGNSNKIINKVLEDAYDNDELTEYGQDAKDYFLKKNEKEIFATKEADAQRAREQAQYQKQYEDQFVNTLKEKSLMAEDKHAIMNSLNSVELQNGNKIPEYQYKLEQIKQNPSDFIELLQILGKYETGKGFNIETSAKAKSEKVKSIYDILNKNSAAIPKSGSTANSTTRRKKFTPRFDDNIPTI